MPITNEQEVRQFIDKSYKAFRQRALTIVEIEAQRSIKKNFEVGGRPSWIPSKKKGRYSKSGNRFIFRSGGMSQRTLVMSGALSSPSAVRDDDEGSVTLITNPLTRAYARIHQEGGTIHHPSRPVRFRVKTYKDKSSRTVFASAKHKKISKVTMTKSYTVTMPARPYMVIPDEDISMWIKRIEGKS